MSVHLKSTDEVVDAYVALRTRVIELVRNQPATARDLPVPHCPAWTAGDVLAHMVGVNEDILAGRMEGVTTEAWTQAQVDRHRGESLAHVADIWEGTIAAFDAVLPVIPAPVNSQLVLDAVTHEHDLRHAFGVPGGRDESAVSVAVGWILHTAEQKSSGLAVNLQRSLDADDLSAFDVLRVATGRRSAIQITDLGLDAGLIGGLLAGTPLSIPVATIPE
ncbi:MAG: maleylpyruvate isomerase N-terminal domain-containing protein [Ilumatobacteraceae bacterium]